MTRQLSEVGLPRTVPQSIRTTSANSSPIDDGKKMFNLQEIHEPEPSNLDQLLFGSREPKKQERQYCVCWCQGWAEIYVRRPTGDMSWVIRIQNQNNFQTSLQDFPLADITTLFMPPTSSKHEQFEDFVIAHKCINSENLAESDYDAILDQHFEQDLDHPVATSAPIGIGRLMNRFMKKAVLEMKMEANLVTLCTVQTEAQK